MWQFVGLELSDDAIPDESTILRFRHLLEAHRLTEQLFEAVRGPPEAKGLLLKARTIVDTTILSAPSSTKNTTGARDPAMKQTRKGKTWYFGMKVHVGTDRRGLVHSLTTTDAAQADVRQLPQLLHGEERALYGDRAYWSEADRRACEASCIRYRVSRRGTEYHPLSERGRQINRAGPGAERPSPRRPRLRMRSRDPRGDCPPFQITHSSDLPSSEVKRATSQLTQWRIR